jgi:hypothetical protein
MPAPSRFKKNPGDTAIVKRPNPTRTAQTADRPTVLADRADIGESGLFIPVICPANRPFSTRKSATINLTHYPPLASLDLAV